MSCGSRGTGGDQLCVERELDAQRVGGQLASVAS